jgi:fatty-acyl-CoA synthase
MCMPQQTAALAAHPGWATADLGSVRTVQTGSTIIRGSAVAPWQQKGVVVVQGYGMTEAPNIGVTPPSEAREKVLAGVKPAMYQEIRVVDPLGNVLPAGASGEIWTRGPGVMLGYWENPEATRDAFNDGWFRTGDVGVFDAEGYLRIVDRVKDIIIVGSSNVYPSDLEAVLSASPDIREAAVVGRPDEDLGEVPVACVVLAPGRSLSSEQVISLFRDRLAAYEHPRDVLFLEVLPRNSFGKVQKGALQTMVRIASPSTQP